MIKELGNNILMMYEGNTGTISFKIIGYEKGDKYLFAIKEKLDDEVAIYSQTFTESEFTACISEETSKGLKSGSYFWGVKLFRKDDDINEVDTLIGRGVLKVRKGV